ncbi:MAG TPA: adenylyltransferase/cytidyltransferase family protein [Candidatus Udaeobacter sp.]|nr:adenylyltransferase/cytidyltransferase family protein [Candidatus Udaeobacter sp.]
MKKVMAFGTFDILHPGHSHALEAAKKLGDHLTVIVARDATVEKVKGKRALFDEDTRLKNLKKLKIADKVRLGNLGNKYQVVIDEEPDIIALGYDQNFFVDDLEKNINKKTKIVRLESYKPDIYKSSKLRAEWDKNHSL